MPHYERYDRNGNLVEQILLTAQEEAAELDAVKTGLVDAMDVAVFRALFRHENLIRALIRALRATSTAANNAATSAGLPTSANSADLTLDQAKTAFKNLIP